MNHFMQKPAIKFILIKLVLRLRAPRIRPQHHQPGGQRQAQDRAIVRLHLRKSRGTIFTPFHSERDVNVWVKYTLIK